MNEGDERRDDDGDLALGREDGGQLEDERLSGAGGHGDEDVRLALDDALDGVLLLLAAEAVVLEVLLQPRQDRFHVHLGRRGGEVKVKTDRLVYHFGALMVKEVIVQRVLRLRSKRLIKH